MRSKNKNRIIVILMTTLIVTYGYWAFFPSSRPWEPSTEKVPVRLAYQFGFHYGQHIIMDYFDLVEKYSAVPVDVTYNKISGGTTINEAIVAGSIEFASMGIAPAVIGIDTGIGTKIFASMGAKEHMMWTWRDDIQTIADIQPGDKVNLVKPGSIEEVGLIKAFIDIGRTKEDVEAVAIYLSHPDALTSMQMNEIDCDFTGEPYNSQYAELGGYRMITSDSMIWGKIPGSAFIGKVNFCEEHPEIAAAILSAWCEATQWIINNQQEAAQIIGEIYGYEESEAWELWQSANMTWDPTYGLTAVENYAHTLYGLDIISKDLSADELMFPWTRGAAGI